MDSCAYGGYLPGACSKHGRALPGSRSGYRLLLLSSRALAHMARNCVSVTTRMPGTDSPVIARLRLLIRARKLSCDCALPAVRTPGREIIIDLPPICADTLLPPPSSNNRSHHR